MDTNKWYVTNNRHGKKLNYSPSSRWNVKSWPVRNKWERKRSEQRRKWRGDSFSCRMRRDWPTRPWWKLRLLNKIVKSFKLLHLWCGQQTITVLLFYCNLPAAVWRDGWPVGGEGSDRWRGGQTFGPQGCRSRAGEAEVGGHRHEDQGGEKADGAEDEGGGAAGCQTGGTVGKEVGNQPDKCHTCWLLKRFAISAMRCWFQVEGGGSSETGSDWGQGCWAESQTEAAGNHQNNISGAATQFLLSVMFVEYVKPGLLQCNCNNSASIHMSSSS